MNPVVSGPLSMYHIVGGPIIILGLFMYHIVGGSCIILGMAKKWCFMYHMVVIGSCIIMWVIHVS